MSRQQRVSEYIWFARRNTRANFVMLNKKAAMFRVCKPKDLPLYQSGVSAIVALDKWESLGKIVQCCNPRFLMRLIAGKALRDWHIEEWSNGLNCGILCWNDLSHVPASICDAVKKACLSKLVKGFKNGKTTQDKC